MNQNDIRESILTNVFASIAPMVLGKYKRRRLHVRQKMREWRYHDSRFGDVWLDSDVAVMCEYGDLTRRQREFFRRETVRRAGLERVWKADGARRVSEWANSVIDEMKGSQ